MWRAFFLAVGVTLVILGAESLVLDRVVLAGSTTAAAQNEGMPVFTAGGGGLSRSRREIKPPDWAPWSMMSAGAVVIIYSFTIPRRVAS